MRSGLSYGSIFLVLLVSGRFSVSKTIIPEARECFLIPSARSQAHLFGGSGLRRSPPYPKRSVAVEGPDLDDIMPSLPH